MRHTVLPATFLDPASFLHTRDYLDEAEMVYWMSRIGDNHFQKLLYLG